VAIQSTSALNAYATAASSAPLRAESNAGEGALAQGGAGAGRAQNGRPAPGARANAAEAAEAAKVVENVDGQADETSGDEASSAQTAVPALYGSNARSVAGGMPAGSVSFYA